MPLPRTIRLATLLLASGFAVCQEETSSQPTVCPLSDSQSQKSIEAFSKLMPTFTQEPRCVNCHGGVDPFSEGVAGDQSDPKAPRSEHGGGKMDVTADCSGCHDGMLPKRDGSPSKWQMATREHFFLGKDAATLCKQMKQVFPKAEQFIGHLTDDNGNSNFTGTAFLGNRGLDEKSEGPDFKLQPPMHVTAGGLVSLGKDWVAAMGGEFKGDPECGCEPLHYAIRVSNHVEMNVLMTHYVNNSPPVDIPITFQDDGSFSGEGTLATQGAGVVTTPMFTCTGQSSASVALRASGKDVQQFENNSLHLDLENTAPQTTKASAVCPYQRGRSSSQGPSPRIVLPFDFKGKVGELIERDNIIPYPGVQSRMRVELVKRQ